VALGRKRTVCGKSTGHGESSAENIGNQHNKRGGEENEEDPWPRHRSKGSDPKSDEEVSKCVLKETEY